MFCRFLQLYQSTELSQPRSQGFPAAIPYSGIILYYILLPDVAIYAFQICTMLTGYEKLARGFEGNRNREYFKWIMMVV